MRKNSNLAEAKKNKNDEFYTMFEDIEKEIFYYKDHFKDKVVYLNCDDPEESNFWKIFAQLFNEFELRGLISTHYDEEKPTYMLELTREDINLYLNEDGTFNHEALVRHPLEGNGDFRNAESIELLRRADIVVTNPPFSLFREYVAQLMEYEKKFLIIGNKNAVTYKEIFPLLKNNQMWLGITSAQEFMVPKEGGGVEVTTSVVGLTRWFTNLTHRRRQQMLPLYAKQSEKNFPRYDNYDAINVDKVVDIPHDWNGVMGVPITFLDKFNPNQFEIIGLSRYLKTHGMSKKFVDDYYSSGQSGQISEGHPDLCYYDIDNRPVVPYMRVMIKHKLIYDEHGLVIGRRNNNENN